MIKEVTMYSVQCDFPRCERATGDYGDFSCFGDSGQAEDDWTSEDGHVIALDGATLHLCSEHAMMLCVGCDSPEALLRDDEEYYCDDCLDKLEE